MNPDELAEELRKANEEIRRLKNELYMAEQACKNANMTQSEKYAIDEGERAGLESLGIETYPKMSITIPKKSGKKSGKKLVSKKGDNKSKKSRKQ